MPYREKREVYSEDGIWPGLQDLEEGDYPSRSLMFFDGRRRYKKWELP
jgi:hypothetical protein